MPRLFSGIEIPEQIRGHLSMLRAGLNGARWIDPENYHITLRFLGDVDDRTAQEFADSLSVIRAEAFEIRLNNLGSFGGRKPRAVWAGTAPSEALLRLQKAHERAARHSGLAPEARNFKPHVTLARLRGFSASAVAGFLEQNGGFASTPFTVARFVLFSSRASQGGGPYIVEEAYPLEPPGLAVA